MKRGSRRLSALDRMLAGQFHEAVQGRPCVVCGLLWPWMDAHHAIDASHLRRHHLPVYDERNAVPICPAIWGTCHGDHTSAKRRIPRKSLPGSVEEFAVEHGLEWMLERYYETSTREAV